jgi:hypothetical protein
LVRINPGQAKPPYHIVIEITDRVQGKDLLTAIKGFLEKIRHCQQLE